jgi:hypothetical protein
MVSAGSPARRSSTELSPAPQTTFSLTISLAKGGTLANLRGFLIRNGACVIGGTVLTGKSYSAKLSSNEQQIIQLREKHGPELESWWLDHFGFGYQCLTHSEARYLLNTPTAQRVRDQIAQAGEA